MEGGGCLEVMEEYDETEECYCQWYEIRERKLEDLVETTE